MKKILSVAICVVILLSLSSFAVINAAGNIYVKVMNGTDGKYETILSKGDIFCLPSGTDISKIQMSDAMEYCFDLNNRRISSADGIINLEYAKPRMVEGYPGYDVYITYNNETKKYTFLVGENIGTVYLSTSKGMQWINSGKNNKDEGVTAVITDADGKVLYDGTNDKNASSLKGRGNASWGYNKKSYNLKIGTKTNLFGMGKSKKWVLMANYVDPSFMRNTVAYSLALGLGLGNTSKSAYVNLYIDGEYYGLYQLLEKVEIGKERVNIQDLEGIMEDIEGNENMGQGGTSYVQNGTIVSRSNVSSYQYVNGIKNPEDISGGYLVELDNLYYSRESSYFRTDIGNSYVVKSPEFSSKEEMEYVSELFADFEEALYSETGYNKKGKYYAEYCDLDSLCMVYVVNEAVKNWDSYKGSTYFYVDSDKNGMPSKIYMGPVWDYDNSYGNFNSGHFHTDFTELWAEGNNGSGSYKNDFGAKLKQHPDALKLISDYYDKAYNMLKEMYKEGGMLDNLSKKLYGNVVMDRARWGIKGRLSAFFIYETYSDGKDNTPDTAVGYLKNFMKNRNEGLKEKLCGYEISGEYFRVNLQGEDIVMTSPFFKAGDRASVKLNKECNISVLDKNGKEIECTIDGGICYFTMPEGNVTVKAEAGSPEETTSTETTETTEATVETTPVETTTSKETETTMSVTTEETTAESEETLETTISTGTETETEETTTPEETQQKENKGLPIVWAITVCICVIAGILATVVVIVHSRRKNTNER